MGKIMTINCDTCGADLRHTGYESESYLALTKQWKGHTGGAVFSMSSFANHDFPEDMYFCTLKCLRSHALVSGLVDAEPLANTDIAERPSGEGE